YQAQRRKEKASPATFNRETSHLARAFRIAVKSGLLTIVPPFPNRLEESAPRQGFSEHAECLAVRQHLTPAVYQDVLDFAYYSGWRRGEIIGLTLARDRHGRHRHQAGSRTLEDEDGQTAGNVAAVEGGAATTSRSKTIGFADGV